MNTYNPQQTRQTILSAAFEEIYHNGYRAASLNKILERTGLTKGALYHHFPNKQSLGYAVLDEVLSCGVDEYFLKPLAQHENAIDGLKAVFGAAFEMLSETDVQHGCPINNMGQEMAPHDEVLRERLRVIYSRWRDGFSAYLKQGQQKGQVAKSIDAQDAGSFLVAALAGCRSLAKSTGSTEEMAACRRGLEFYIESLRA